MNKIDKVVWRETGYIAAWTLIFSGLMQSVFLMIGKWDLTVLFANLYAGGAAVLNFFLMGLSIQKALAKNPADVQKYIKATSTFRLLGLFGVTVVGALLPCFNVVALLIPLLFPRVAIMLRPFFGGLSAIEPIGGASVEVDTEEATDDDTEEEGGDANE